MFMSSLIHVNHPNYNIHSLPNVLFDLNNIGIIFGEILKVKNIKNIK